MARRKYTVKVNMPNLPKGEAVHTILRSYPEDGSDPTQEAYNFENGAEYVIDLEPEMAKQLKDSHGFEVKTASADDVKKWEAKVEADAKAAEAEAEKARHDREEAIAIDEASAGGEGGDSK